MTGDPSPSAGSRADRTRGVVAWGLFLAWAAAIWTLSSRGDPYRDLGLEHPLPDKAVHLLAFAVGGFLAREAVLPWTRPPSWLSAWIVCAAWGLVDEWHQGFVPGRSAEAGDLAADAAGALLGAVVHRLTFPRGLVRPSL